MGPPLNPFVDKLLRLADAGAAFAVVGIVMMLIVPLPSALLDCLMVLNICLSLITILICMQIKEPLEFSIFPTLLLIATLFRLGLDVSATRMILLYGFIKDPATHEPIGAGHLIPAFGKVVVGGNLVVGFIMFIILILIQILVITKGAERIAQVAARFTLDAMPLKLMAIDGEAASGAITSEQAIAKREKVQQEADFYGSMDGAGRFVQGDAIAAIAIMVVNVLGGIIIGIVYHKMSAWDALNTFAILSIGNGLITTLPAFLMSTAMGLIVSRAANKSNFGGVLTGQFIAQPTALKMGALFMFALGFMGLTHIIAFPPLPFFVLGGLVGYVAHQLTLESAQVEMVQEIQKDDNQKVAKKAPGHLIETQLPVDPISLEVGRGLLSLVNPDDGAKLLERVTSIRRHIVMELGIIVPGMRFKDNLQLKPNSYIIKVREIEVARGEVQVNQFLAIGPEEKLRNLRGTKTTDPTYGMPGVWIAPEQRGDAERLGCMIFDPVSVVATQLTEVIRGYAADLLGHQEVQTLIDGIRKTHPAVVKNIVPDALSLAEVRKILQNLVRERVSIRDLVAILETLIDNVHLTKEPELLTEFVRVALCRNICKEYTNAESTINVMTLDPHIEQLLQSAIRAGGAEMASFMHLDPSTGQEILQAIGEEVDGLQKRGLQPILLTSPPIRPLLRKLTERSFPTLVLLSWNEIAPKVNVNSISMVSLYAKR